MKPRLPNVLLLIADDQAFHAWRSGNSVLRSPATAWLARNGTVFSHAFSPATFCLPSRTSLLTSLFPHQHGWLGNRISIPAPPPRMFLPRELQQAGYETAGFGKWHSPFSPTEAGFSFFDRMAFTGRTPPTQITSAATEYLARRPAGAPPWFLWLSYVQPYWPWG
ncbi:MAG: sulfatase, partial [Planctomycetota bacterium]